MSFINYETRQIFATVVWYGPTGSGKTTTLRHVYERTRTPGAETVRVDPAPGQDAAAYEYLPLSLGEIRGHAVTFRLFTVPGAPEHASVRRALLEHVDGLIFAADCRPDRQQENLVSLSELRHHLASWGFALERMPLVIQCSFSDASDALPATEVAAPLLSGHPSAAAVPVVGSVPPQGVGVFEALKLVAKQILTELKRG